MTARGPCLLAATCLALAACDVPAEPDTAEIDVAFLLDRVNGAPPPARVCDQDAVVQNLHYESIALLDDGSYGRLQVMRIEDDPPIQQEERGEFARTDSTILLINAAEDTITLALLDSAAAHVRRIHACGDTLRYQSVPVGDS